MKRFLLTIMAAAVAISFTACGDTASNAPANNANAANTAAKPAAAPSKETLLDMDKKAHEAYSKGDTAYFEGILSDKFVAYNRGVRMTKADEIKMISSMKCEDVSISLDEAEMSKINDDTYALTYKSTFEGKCMVDGKAKTVPSPTRSTTVWMRNGDKWQAAFHGETLIVDPKAAPAAADTAKKEEPKKDEAAPAKPTPSANTEALVKLHTGGWEAWKANDAKWFNDTLTESAAIVDPIGRYVSGKAALVKLWTDATLCEGVTKTSLSDTFASAISPTVEILTLKGTADGKCDGQPNGALYQTAVYVKEGDAWKMAFMFESPAM
jgi:ketosteroid isomerase-like protein